MIVEPHPLLLDYHQKASQFQTDVTSLRNFYEVGEWHWILSNIEQNICLLERLDEKNLLSDKNHIIDCGVGLGTTLFDLYLQSKEIINRKFTFTGIEKFNPYLDYLNENLIQYWNGELELISGDIQNYDYSKFDIIYCYTPLKDLDKLARFYQKVANEIKPGSIIIENKNNGYGVNNIMLEINGLSKIDLDDIVVFTKSKKHTI